MNNAVKPNIRVGQRWREWSTGRIVLILQEEVHGTGPAWEYEDDGSWHYCDLLDFYLWDRFELVPFVTTIKIICPDCAVSFALKTV